MEKAESYQGGNINKDMARANLHTIIKNRPGTLAKADVPSKGKRAYKQETLNHLSYYQFYLDEHEHWHNEQFP